METSPQGIAEIASHEGVVPMPYRDSKGIWTYGVGHTAAAGLPDPAKMTKGAARPIADVMALFARDLQKYEAGVNKALKVPVKQHEFDALVSFHYNTGAIARATLMKRLNAGDRAGAARAFMNWTRPVEITGRRRKERDLFRYGQYGDGRATIYPANSSGTVQWAKGKRVRVLDYMEDGGTPPTHEKPLKHYQQRLLDLGYDPGPIDNLWGKRTSAAVEAFQFAQKGALVVDGILGPLTSAAIDQAYAARPSAVAVKTAALAIPTAGAAYVAGFTFWPMAALGLSAGAIYLAWCYRDALKERISAWIG